jgi:N-ethylmaleimide reductase
VPTTNPSFNALELGALTLPKRIVMAPLTRCRADSDHIPTEMMATYYAQRASAGLIITEATMVIEGNSSFGGREPGTRFTRLKARSPT